MKNYELINELMKYPAYCEVSVEVDREWTDTGEVVALSEGIICSEKFLDEEFGDYGITLHITGSERSNRWQHAHDRTAKRQMVRLEDGEVVRSENGGGIAKDDRSSNQKGLGWCKEPETVVDG